MDSRVALKAETYRMPRKRVCERGMSEADINRRFQRLADLYDLALALKKAGKTKVREAPARYKARPKRARLKPKA